MPVPININSGKLIRLACIVNQLRHTVFLIALLTSLTVHAQVPGCTDILATNYNASATVNDGSCLYENANIQVLSSHNLGPELEETSGLLHWQELLWSHNDDRDTSLYALNLNDGSIQSVHPLKGVRNKDWEEIAQDENHLYIGDFGNNAAGNRRDLHILRIAKNNFSGLPHIDTISFYYEDQQNFTATAPNQTDFDCEAFVVLADSIYLFTKEWLGGNSRIYVLPAIPGNHAARFVASLPTNGMVTGATYLAGEQLVVLCGYTSFLQPFVYLLYDFHDQSLSSGNKRRISISKPFHQIEGIATTDGRNYFVSNEKFVQAPIVSINQGLHTLNLTAYLDPFLNRKLNQSLAVNGLNLKIYPSPGSGILYCETATAFIGGNYTVHDLKGKVVLRGKITSQKFSLPTTGLSKDYYLMHAEAPDGMQQWSRFMR
jgi:hypothetical protein